MNARVDSYVRNTKWQKEVKKMRMIALECGLTEDFKWSKPCYSYHKSNVVIIQGFKEYCALLFFKGVLLHDPDGILQKTGEHTRVGRQIRFTHVREIVEIESAVKACIYEAIEVERAGLKVNLKAKAAPPIVEEFRNTLKKSPALKAAFQALTSGRQRAYNIYFSSAKQSKTRMTRIEKCAKQILLGKGLSE